MKKTWLPFLLACVSVALTVSAKAQRTTLKPSDFEPLTSLPWKWPGATLDSVLDAIFREPNVSIRYPVLAEYLRTMPVVDLSKAFDVCVTLECKQSPDSLIDLFLPIWAERDPQPCWKRTRDLFRLVGIEEGWLGYDSWKESERIAVHDRDAIAASPFWIRHRDVLTGFGSGVGESSLPKKERVRLMKEFVDVWFRAFGSWPGHGTYGSEYSSDFQRVVVTAFDSPADLFRSSQFPDGNVDRAAAFEVVLRRWLETEPAAAQEIVKKSGEKEWRPLYYQSEKRIAGPSTELLMIWARVDQEGIIRWADSLDVRKDELAGVAKGLLMSRVATEKRNRWLSDAKSAVPEENRVEKLLSHWAGWDPKPALDAAVATDDADTINSVAFRGTYGPFDNQPWNSSRFGIGVVKNFDVTSLPDEIRKAVVSEWGITIMEQWGDIDIGEAARYGVDFLLRADYAPRDRLTRFFSGHDEYPDEGGMIDRTFCALRVWAVVKPKEMKAWIATIKEADMRKALTWLLDHPWGTGPKK